MILVFGSHGLLGSAICTLDPKDTIGVSRDDMDVLNIDEVYRIIDRSSPDTIINCIGHVPRSKSPFGDWINREFPHYLNAYSQLKHIRLIHISTDCVFGKDKAERTENEMPDSTELYGLQKTDGEFESYTGLVIRTSFVGLPDPPGRGLLAWVRRNSGKRINGWRACLWNGLTTFTLGRILLDFAYRPEVRGLLHVFGETLSKYELVSLVNDVYKFGCTVVPVMEPISYRTLGSCWPVMPYEVPSIYDQITEMSQRNPA